MSVSINLHPIDKKWKSVEVEIYPENRGACLIIHLADKFSFNTVAIHYGSEENKEEFIKMMKEAFAKLNQGEEEKDV